VSMNILCYYYHWKTNFNFRLDRAETWCKKQWPLHHVSAAYWEKGWSLSLSTDRDICRQTCWYV